MKYEDWVKKVNKNSQKADDEWGEYYLYLVFDEDRLVGLLNIRFDLSNKLKEMYGDIEYGVKPSERRKCKFINGKYYDSISMDILAEEFEGDYIRNKNI